MNNNIKKYFIEEANDEDWNSLINLSKDTTLFYENFFLNNISKKIIKLVVKSKNNLKAGISFEYNKKKIIKNKFLIYSGIIFIHEKNIKISSKISDEIKITNIILEYLIKNFNEIYISTFVENIDLRPFSWFHFEKKFKELKYDLRYTAYLDISSFKNLEKNNTNINNYLIMNSLRKRMILKGLRQGYKAVIDDNKEFLINSYKQMSSVGSLEWTKKDISKLSDLIETILKNNKGKFCHIEDKNNTRLYSVFYAWDKYKAYFLFGGSMNKVKNDWAGTIAHWEMFKYLSKNKKIFIVDLEGVNSPYRGHFKTSFGAKLEKYFHINILN